MDLDWDAISTPEASAATPDWDAISTPLPAASPPGAKLPVAKADEAVANAPPSAWDAISTPAPASGGVDDYGRPLPGGAVPPVPVASRPYALGMAVRPDRGQDAPYVPTGGMRVPDQGMFGAMAANLAGSAVSSTADTAAGAVRGAGRLIDRYQDPETAQANAMTGYDPPPRTAAQAATKPIADRIAEAGKAGAAAFPIDSKYADSTWVKSAGMVGGALPYLAAGALSGGTGAVASALAGAASSYESIYQDAIAHGASEDEAHQAALVPSLTGGVLMSANAGVILNKLPYAMQNALVRPIVDLFASSGTMVATSKVQKLVNNANAKATYDPDRPLMQGVADDTAAEALGGALLHGAIHGPGQIRAGAGAVRDALQTKATADPALQAGVRDLTRNAELVNERQPVTPVGTEPAPPAKVEPTVPDGGGLFGGTQVAPEKAAATKPEPVVEAAPPEAPARAGNRAVDTTLTPEARGLLDTIAGTESPGYDVMYGGKRFTDFTQHPHQGQEITSGPHKGEMSTAAGRYQFLGSTWEPIAKQLGLTDFSPANQDKAAWFLAQRTYAEKTGRDLQTDLTSTDPKIRDGIGTALSGQWTSLPGGIEAGTNKSKFAAALDANTAHHLGDSEGQPTESADRSVAGDAPIEQTDTRPANDPLVDQVAQQMGKPDDEEPARGDAGVVDPRDAAPPPDTAPLADAASNAPKAAVPVAEPVDRIQALSDKIDRLRSGIEAVGRVGALHPDAAAVADYGGLGPAKRALGGMQRSLDYQRGHAEIAALLDSYAGDPDGAPFRPAKEYAGDDAKPVWGALPKSTPSLASIVKSLGGIKPEGRGVDDMRAMDLHKQPGFFNKRGLTPERMAELMRDQGYLGDQDWSPNTEANPDPLAKLLDAIDFEKGGQRFHNRYNAEAEASHDNAQAYRDQALRVADQLGLSPTAAKALTYGQVRDAIASPHLGGAGHDPATAGHDYVAPHDERPEYVPPDGFTDDIPFSRRFESGRPADAGAPAPTRAAIAARQRLRDGAEQMMRFMGLPPKVGLKLVDRLLDGGADGSYARGVVTLALDTPPDQIAAKLFHETVHALMDPSLGLLTPGQRETLLRGADAYLRDNPATKAHLQALYGTDPTMLREEAVARMGEDALRAGMVAQRPATRLYGKLLNTVRALGSVLRGQGYRTSQDVFNGLLRGRQALPGSREALLRDRSPPPAVPPAAPAPEEPQAAAPEPPPEPAAVTPPSASAEQPSLPFKGTPGDKSAANIIKTLTPPEVYLSRRLTPDRDPRQKDLLFGRPETPASVAPKAPVAPPRVGVVPGNRGGDFARFMQASGQEPHRAATDWVLQAGRATGHEHGVAIDGRTGQVLAATTDRQPSKVSFPDGMVDQIQSPQNAVVFHHNHPGSSPVSATDVTMLGFPGLAQVIAHGHDGTFSSAKLGPAGLNFMRQLGDRPNDIHNRINYLTRLTNGLTNRVTREIQDMVNARIVDHVEAGKHLWMDTIQRALHFIGVTDYLVSKEPPPHLQELQESVLHSVVKDYARARNDRPAIAIRADAGVAGLSPRDANPAAGPAGRAASPASDRSGAGSYLPPRNGRLLEGPQYSRRDEPGADLGLHSAVVRAAEGLKQAKGTGEQMLAAIANQPGVKPEEMKYLGLADWLRGQKSVTKADVAAYVRANALQLEETVRAGQPYRPLSYVRDLDFHAVQSVDDIPMARLRHAEFDNDVGNMSHEEAYQAVVAEREYRKNPPKLTQYRDYALPGGEKYQEMLLTLPVAVPEHERVNRAMIDKYGNLSNAFERMTPEESAALHAAHVRSRLVGQLAGFIESGVNLQKLVSDPETLDIARTFNPHLDETLKGHSFEDIRGAVNDALKMTDVYRSGHWQEPNVVAHTRVDERTTPDGKRALMVHEVQSDWHQAGRRQGYQVEPPASRFTVIDGNGNQRGDFESRAEAEAYRANPPPGFHMQGARIEAVPGAITGVPDAPFKTSWPMLVMKRLIGLAVERGLDRVAWSPGQVHADRYNLGRQVEAIDYKQNPDGTYRVRARHYGRGQNVGDDIPASKLRELVGEDVAKRIIDGHGKPVDVNRDYGTPSNMYTRLSGLDLKMGGEGMKGFYDQILPKEVNKLIGKFGGKVERSEIHLPYDHADEVVPDAIAQAEHGERWERLRREFRAITDDIEANYSDPDKRDALYDKQDRVRDAMDELNDQMVQDTIKRGTGAPVHSFDITPALRKTVAEGGLPMFSKRLPAKLSDKQGLEREGQGSMFGSSAVQAQAARDAAGNLRSDAKQKPVEDLPLFNRDPKQGSLFSLRQNLQTAIVDGADRTRVALNDMLNQALFPMRGGSEVAQRAAFKFANALRDIQYRYAKIDRQILKQFNAAERAEMGRALDAQSVFEQSQPTAAERAAFDAAGTGLAGLTDKQRSTVLALDQIARQSWQRMQARNMVMPTANGLPMYMPRQFVMMDGLGGTARRITKADALVNQQGQGQLAGIGGGSAGGGGGLTAMDKVGGNLTTRGVMSREHLTPAESQAAARAKFGPEVAMVEDIRSLLDALQRQERAIAGRDLVDAIKRQGQRSGQVTVVQGVKPKRDFFTLDHPALWTVGPTGAHDADGKPIYGRVPLHIASEFEGPLRAVLGAETGDWYKAINKVKSTSMGAIMFSPFMHLGVEIGRTLPLYKGDPFAVGGAMLRGGRLKADDAFMRQAVADGLAPIGQGFGKMDPVSVMDQSTGARTATWPQKILAGDTKLQRGWHELHQKLLWDQVFNLQTGIYSDMRDRFIDKGFSPKGAGIMAAHLANRYAGALPPEHLSRGANMLANLALFSRSFTLGNLGVIKDMTNGMPSHIQAALRAEEGTTGAARGQALLRRKAISAFALDIGAFFALNGLAQIGFGIARNSPSMGLSAAAQQEWHDYLDHFRDHWLPQSGNEPGKQDRVYIGKDSGKRGVYARLPLGKVGEEFAGYFEKPGTMILNKLSPWLRAVGESVIGADTLGSKVYNPHPETVMDHLKVGRDVALHIAGSMLPTDFLVQTKDLVTGAPKGDPYVATARVLGPLLGLGSISQGNPEGPMAGVQRAASDRVTYARQQAMPQARRLVEAGKLEDAEKLLTTALGDPKAANTALRSLLNPGKGAVRLDRQFQRIATPEEQARAAGVTGGRGGALGQ